MWIWFFARARGADKSVTGREELISILSDVLHSRKVAESLTR
jgi:hypothetical protein